VPVGSCRAKGEQGTRSGPALQAEPDLVGVAR
jgi:hypothetical protein